MAVRPILRMGHPLLRRPALPVPRPASEAVRALVRDLVDTMEAAPGTGLAAPQIGESLQVVVYLVAPERAEREGCEAVPLTVLVNPRIEPLTDAVTAGWEACLSVPDLAGEVPRWDRVRVTATDLEGRPLVREAAGFHARVLQHEIDHLSGILYPERMPDLTRLAYRSELPHLLGQAKEAKRTS